MTKFHVNAKGEVRPCGATKRPCRFGAENHYASEEEAERAIGKQSHNQESPMTKKKTATPANSVEKLSATGIESTTIKSIRDHTFIDTDPYTSSIDLIPEKNAKKLLDDIMSGKIKAFA